MTNEMDAVDRQQQREIDDLKDFIKNLLWSFVVFAVIQFCSILAFLHSFRIDEMGLCPHVECPHHKVDK